MSGLSPRPLAPALVPSLNALLAALALPFTLDDPTDLTPSLLLAIFESLINARLPIPSSVRQSRTRDAKARAMLVLLGVLECDVLRGGIAAVDAEHSVAASTADDSVLGGAGGVSVDGWVDEIGLGEVDPERLADGGWEETIFVGELLCWLARRKGILPRTKSPRRPSHSRSLYSNHHSYGTEGEGDTADFSTSLLLRPSPTPKSRSPRPPSPSLSIDDPDADADFSTLSHISDVPRHPLVHSPEPSLSASATTGTDLSIRARSVSSRTTVSNAHDDPDQFEEASQDTVQMYDPRQMMQDAEDDDDLPPTFRPQCIHDLEDPSYIRELAGPSSSFDPSVSHERVYEDEDDASKDEEDEQDNDDPYAPPTPTPQRVRLTGWIDSVDSTTELDQFITSRAHSYSRSRAIDTSTRSGSEPRLSSHGRAGAGEPSRSAPRLKPQLSRDKTRTPRRASPISSPSPSPSPPPAHPSKRPLSRRPPSPPPSPPSPPTEPEPAFDVSFSSLNNTSTPARPRPPRRTHTPMTARHESEGEARLDVERHRSGGGAAATATGRRHRDRVPSYTPSPPSFSTPGHVRSGGSSGSGANARITPGSTTRLGASATSVLSSSVSSSAAGVAAVGRRSSTSPFLPSSSGTTGRSPVLVAPAGSTTAMTNTLLTERARLLTELAALKRARAASGAGTGGGASGSGGVSGRRVGVGV